MIYPVSVVVPHQKSRAEFFHAVCLPSIERNNPAQIIVVDRPGGANEKRNEGASKAMYDHLLFVDDDAELLPDAIEHALSFLESDKSAAFAYGDRIIVEHKPPKEMKLPAVAWDHATLKRANFIDVTALIRKEYFPGFDLRFRRFQDWDLWLTIAGRGGHGIYARRPLHKTHRIDQGISARESLEINEQLIIEKHKLIR